MLDLLLAMAAAPAVLATVPVACFYDNSPPADLQRIFEGPAQAGEDPTPERAAALERGKKVMKSCADRYEWSEQEQVAASFYANGRQVYEAARPKLATYGLEPDFFDRAAAALTDEQRAAFLRMDTDPAMQVIFKMLTDRDVRMANDSEASWSELGELIGTGMGGLLMRDKALSDYAAPARRD